MDDWTFEPLLLSSLNLDRAPLCLTLIVRYNWMKFPWDGSNVFELQWLVIWFSCVRVWYESTTSFAASGVRGVDDRRWRRGAGSVGSTGFLYVITTKIWNTRGTTTTRQRTKNKKNLLLLNHPKQYPNPQLQLPNTSHTKALSHLQSSAVGSLLVISLQIDFDLCAQGWTIIRFAELENANEDPKRNPPHAHRGIVHHQHQALIRS